MPRSRGRTGRPWRRARDHVRRTQNVCHLCGLPIDYALDWPDPMSFTVDHVEPLSHNEHLALDLSNLKAAHLKCNSSKGNGEGTEVTRNSRRW